MPKIAVLSHAVVDEIHRPDGSTPVEQVGGAGAYAAVGVSLATTAGESLLVSGTGRGDRPAIEAWARGRGIDPRGLFDVGEHGPRTRIDYFADGERDETPAYGLDHFVAHTPLPRHVPEPASGLDGAYLFHAHEEPYWSEVAAWRTGLTGPLLWEISRDSCTPAHLARVRELGELVDVLSINAAEAGALLRVEGDAVIDELAGLAPVVVLRSGERGSLVIRGDERIGLPARPVDAIDPTGGGNSYSGAFLAAYARTGDPVAAGRIATAAAALVVATPGAPGIDDTVRAAVAARGLPTTGKESA